MRTGGLYRVCAGQPSTHFVEWNGKDYTTAKLYSEKAYHRPDSAGVEFRHYMNELFNGLLDLNFAIQRVYEAPYSHLTQYVNAPQGSWNHERSYVAGEFVIVAKRQ